VREEERSGERRRERRGVVKERGEGIGETGRGIITCTASRRARCTRNTCSCTSCASAARSSRLTCL